MTRRATTQRDRADSVLDDAIRHALYGSDPLVVVKSPPGAGKTYLVECAAVAAVTAVGMKVVCITPGVKQAYDVAERTLAYDLRRRELVHAKHRELPASLQGRIIESKGWNPTLNQGPGVLIANAHALAPHLSRLSPATFDLAVIDEAYQLAAADFLPVADLAPRVLMVGDPGQLPPVNSVDAANLEASAHPMHWAAPAYALKRFPATPVYGLPVTRRLLPDTARLVQSAFYPDLPFTSVVDPAARRLRFELPGIDPRVDAVLDAIAAGASVVGLVVPGTPPVHEETDTEVAAIMARLAQRVLMRQGTWVGERLLDQSDIGCIDPNVITGGGVAAELRRLRLPKVRVETVERWQGLQVPLAIVRHPFSRVGKPAPFDLEAGRWCVSLSRHQIGCVIVARGSVENVLREYVHPCDSTAAGARDEVWSGFQAHARIWSELHRLGRIFYA